MHSQKYFSTWAKVSMCLLLNKLKIFEECILFPNATVYVVVMAESRWLGLPNPFQVFLQEAESNVTCLLWLDQWTNSPLVRDYF